LKSLSFSLPSTLDMSGQLTSENVVREEVRMDRGWGFGDGDGDGDGVYGMHCT